MLSVVQCWDEVRSSQLIIQELMRDTSSECAQLLMYGANFTSNFQARKRRVKYNSKAVNLIPQFGLHSCLIP